MCAFADENLAGCNSTVVLSLPPPALPPHETSASHPWHACCKSRLGVFRTARTPAGFSGCALPAAGRRRGYYPIALPGPLPPPPQRTNTNAKHYFHSVCVDVVVCYAKDKQSNVSLSARRFLQCSKTRAYFMAVTAASRLPPHTHIPHDLKIEKLKFCNVF